MQRVNQVSLNILNNFSKDRECVDRLRVLKYNTNQTWWGIEIFPFKFHGLQTWEKNVDKISFLSILARNSRALLLEFKEEFTHKKTKNSFFSNFSKIYTWILNRFSMFLVFMSFKKSKKRWFCPLKEITKMIIG